MQIGYEPKNAKEIKIKKMKDCYEILFTQKDDSEFWFYLAEKELIELWDKISWILQSEDNTFDMLREKQDYANEISKAAFDVKCPFCEFRERSKKK